MKSIGMMSITLITFTMQLSAAAGKSWTTDELLRQTIAYRVSTDGFTVEAYGTSTLSPHYPSDTEESRNFGFLLLPPTDAPAEKLQDPMYFRITNNNELETEQGKQTIAAYTHISSRKFLLLFPHEDRRIRLSKELEANSHLLDSIEKVAAVCAQWPESTFVVFDVARYTQAIIAENLRTSKAMHDVLESVTTALPAKQSAYTRGRSTSF